MNEQGSESTLRTRYGCKFEAFQILGTRIYLTVPCFIIHSRPEMHIVIVVTLVVIVIVISSSRNYNESCTKVVVPS